ncbi:MAG: hypothetical protein AB4058_03260 [Microcystaceae cyanobacterium]
MKNKTVPIQTLREYHLSGTGVSVLANSREDATGKLCDLVVYLKTTKANISIDGWLLDEKGEPEWDEGLRKTVI